MATVDLSERFAEQAVRVERVLRGSGVTGNAGRIILLLTLASARHGVSQKEVLLETGRAKDVVSKLIRSMVRAGLITQQRDLSNRRMKRLITSDAGRDVLRRVKAALQSSRSSDVESPTRGGLFDLFE